MGLFVQELANLGFIVIATPYDLTFDHCKCAEAVAERLDRALAQLCIHAECDEQAPEGFQTLPVFAVGHSNGALLNLLAARSESYLATVPQLCLLGFSAYRVQTAMTARLTTL